MKKSAEPEVYVGWPFGEDEAARRQRATADALGVGVDRSVDRGGGVSLDLVLVPAGEFLMGSDESPDETMRKCDGTYENGDRFANEHPQHRVRITQPLYVGKHAVTQAQWERLMGTNPSCFRGATLPVDSVCWHDAQEFVRKLNALHGGGGVFGMPTEAEWEYACRAGTPTPFHFGETLTRDQANYDDAYTYGPGRRGERRATTTPVGSFRPNAWGLYDMHGNVWEWCADWHDAGAYAQSERDDPTGPPAGERRALRGGSWSYNPGLCRSAARGWLDPHNRDARLGLGFRVVLRAPAARNNP